MLDRWTRKRIPYIYPGPVYTLYSSSISAEHDLYVDRDFLSDPMAIVRALTITEIPYLYYMNYHSALTPNVRLKYPFRFLSKKSV